MSCKSDIISDFSGKEELHFTYSALCRGFFSPLLFLAYCSKVSKVVCNLEHMLDWCLLVVNMSLIMNAAWQTMLTHLKNVSSNLQAQGGTIYLRMILGTGQANHFLQDMKSSLNASGVIRMSFEDNV